MILNIKRQTRGQTFEDTINNLKSMYFNYRVKNKFVLYYNYNYISTPILYKYMSIK